MATATDDEQDHVGVHYSGPHAGCLTHEADLKSRLAAAGKQNETLRMLLTATQGHRDAAAEALAAAEARCAELQGDVTRCHEIISRQRSVLSPEDHAEIDEAAFRELEDCGAKSERLREAESRAARYEAALREIAEHVCVWRIGTGPECGRCYSCVARAALAGQEAGR